FFSSRRRHTRFDCDWSSDVCSSDLEGINERQHLPVRRVSKYCRRDSTGSPRHLTAVRNRAMQRFEFVRPKDSAAAIATASKAKTDRKSTRLNSSHSQISYAVFCLKK